MLELHDLQVAYGAAPALWGVSLEVRTGELLCVVGPNGAGKTTLINAIAGIQRVRGGRIVFEGRDITALPRTRWMPAIVLISVVLPAPFGPTTHSSSCLLYTSPSPRD